MGVAVRTTMLKILIVDPDPTFRLRIAEAIRSDGHQVISTADTTAALPWIDREHLDLVVANAGALSANSHALLRHTRATACQPQVLVTSDEASVAEAVGALKSGASDYLVKPIEPEQVLRRASRIADHQRLSQGGGGRGDCRWLGGLASIVGSSPRTAAVKDRIDAVAASDAPVVITGERGTGKELVARTIHQRSARRDGPFVTLNCAAFPDGLIEAELFGCEPGAVKGGNRRGDGRLVAADGGTLVLNEIGKLPISVQANLLRVLEDSCVVLVGSDTPISVDVRLVCTTCGDLRQLVADNQIREDLYYRLNVLDLHIPELRNRHEDLPELVAHFLVKYTGKERRITPSAWAALRAYQFPGNVRELEHAIEHAVTLARQGDIELMHLPADIAATSAPESAVTKQELRPLGVAIKEFERQYLTQALQATGGKKTRAAELLGISRKNLWQKLRFHDLNVRRRRKSITTNSPQDQSCAS